MRGVVYADVLVLVNAVIGFLLLRCTTRLAGLAYRRWRAALGGLLAGGSALLLLLPPLPGWAVWGLKLASACLIVLAAFGAPGARGFLRALAWYAALNTLLCGVVFAALYYGVAGGIEVHNLTLYFNVPPLLLIGCVLAVYFAMRLYEAAFGRPGARESAPFSVQLECGGCVRLHGVAMVDTGFHVRDPIAGRPAFLLSYPSVKSALPPPLARALEAYFASGALTSPLFLVPVKTAGGVRAFPALRAQGLRVGGERRGEQTALFSPQVLADGGCDAIVGP